MATTKVTTGGITDATIATADIADQAVTLAKLPHGTSSNDGKFLRANNGADPSFETVSIPAGTTINNNADNRVITGSGTANTLNGESGLTFDGTELKIGGDSNVSGTWGLEVYNTTGTVGTGLFAGTGGAEIKLQDTVSGETIKIAANGQASFYSQKAGDPMVFYTKPSGGTDTVRLRIDSSGNVGINQTPTRELSLHSPNNNNALIHFTNDDTGETAADGILVGLDGNENMVINNQETGKSIYVYNGGSERMRLDSSGNVGIGVVHDPLTALHVEGANNAALRDVLTLTNRTGSAGTEVGMVLECGTDEIARISAKHEGSDIGPLKFYTASSQGADPTEKVSIGSDGRTAITTNSTFSNRLTDASSSADDLVISGDSDTGITIYTNNTSSKSNIYFADSADADVGRFQYLHNNNQFRLYVNANGTPVMQWNHDLTIYFNGNMYSNGNSYSTGSDLRLKSNLVRFTNTLDNLKKLTGYKFDIKCGENRDSTRKSAGVIAQDVEKVYPELVEEVGGYKHLEYSAFTGILVEAVKELTTKVETLETKVAALTA